MKFFAWLMVIGSTLLLLSLASGAAASPYTQEATVTGTPEGPRILVPEQVNVRIGPSTDYDKVGVLIAVQPTFDETQADLPGGFPPILAIMGLLVVGLFGTVISVLRGG